jgi:hypothetical protein
VLTEIASRGLDPRCMSLVVARRQEDLDAQGPRPWAKGPPITSAKAPRDDSNRVDTALQALLDGDGDVLHRAGVGTAAAPRRPRGRVIGASRVVVPVHPMVVDRRMRDPYDMVPRRCRRRHQRDRWRWWNGRWRGDRRWGDGQLRRWRLHAPRQGDNPEGETKPGNVNKFHAAAPCALCAPRLCPIAGYQTME